MVFHLLLKIMRVIYVHCFSNHIRIMKSFNKKIVKVSFRACRLIGYVVPATIFLYTHLHTMDDVVNIFTLS